MFASPSVTASVAIHCGAAVATAVHPAFWPWTLSAVAANHAVLTAAGLWPRSSLLGANWTRLPDPSIARNEVALTIDDGPDPEVTPRVLELLAAHDVHATFFCVGERVRRFDALSRRIVAAGHSIENHSQRHRHNFSLLGPAGMRAEIAHAQDSIAAVTGITPQFFRAPAGLRNPFLDPVLQSLDLRLASWTRRGFDTVNPDPERIYQRLTHGLRSGDILLLHDSHAARDTAGVPVILPVLPRLLNTFRAHGLKPVTLRAALAPAPTSAPTIAVRTP